MKLEEARKHHKKHGDMDGHTCLLNECPIHYPKKEEIRKLIVPQPKIHINLKEEDYRKLRSSIGTEGISDITKILGKRGYTLYFTKKERGVK